MGHNGKHLALEVDGKIVQLSGAEASALRYALRRALQDARQRTNALERVCAVVALREDAKEHSEERSDDDKKLRVLQPAREIG